MTLFLVDLWKHIDIWWDVELLDELSVQYLVSWYDIVYLNGGQRKAFDVLSTQRFDLFILCFLGFTIDVGMVVPKKSYDVFLDLQIDVELNFIRSRGYTILF
uniref:Uncharacterized protein n=1 Tax=Lactuca sativa TaxID=4236 RepID=A0A9R1XPS5_LACSA|nr:hypothetical protein LSAT_V11C300153550 [Lactuca sativa]